MSLTNQIHTYHHHKHQIQTAQTCTDHNKSISTIEPASIVIGRWRFSICSTWFIDRPIPPCIQMIFFSIKAARGSQLNNRLIRCHAHIPSLSPCSASYTGVRCNQFMQGSRHYLMHLIHTIRSMHSIRKPKSALISAASWFPRIKCTFRGYSTCKIDVNYVNLGNFQNKDLGKQKK